MFMMVYVRLPCHLTYFVTLLSVHYLIKLIKLEQLESENNILGYCYEQRNSWFIDVFRCHRPSLRGIIIVSGSIYRRQNNENCGDNHHNINNVIYYRYNTTSKSSNETASPSNFH